MAMHNVVIKAAYAALNVDSYNRTAVNATANMDNGTVFTLKEKSTTPGEKDVWKVAAATAADTEVWMAASPEVVITGDAPWQFRGLINDPRAFDNKAGRMIDAIKLVPGDIIEMTGEGITGIDTAAYLVPGAANFGWTVATAAGAGVSLRKVGTGKLHIGSGAILGENITTYKFAVESK